MSRNASLTTPHVVTLWDNRRFVAKLVYNEVLDKNARLGLHDALIRSIDESGMNGTPLRQTLELLFEGLRREGIGIAVLDDAF